MVALLGTTVAAGIGTFVIAVRGADPLVSDDYYRDGKSINRILAADREATLREATAKVSFEDGIVIALNIVGELPAALELDLSHVTRAQLDRSVRLERVSGSGGQYEADATLPDGRFYATLRPAGEGRTWRLRRPIELPADRTFELEPDP
jgi:hypothetical protein